MRKRRPPRAQDEEGRRGQGFTDIGDTTIRAGPVPKFGTRGASYSERILNNTNRPRSKRKGTLFIITGTMKQRTQSEGERSSTETMAENYEESEPHRYTMTTYGTTDLAVRTIG